MRFIKEFQVHNSFHKEGMTTTIKRELCEFLNVDPKDYYLESKNIDDCNCIDSLVFVQREYTNENKGRCRLYQMDNSGEFYTFYSGGIGHYLVKR